MTDLREFSKREAEEALLDQGMQNCVLEEMDCRGMAWKNSRLERFVLRHVHIGAVSGAALHWSNGTLTQVNMRKLRSQGARLDNLEVSGGDWVESKWSSLASKGVHFQDSNLANISLEAAFLEDWNLLDTDLSRANLSRISWSGGKARDSRLGGANLTGVDLRGALLVGVDLEGANLCGAQLSDTLFIDVNLRGSELADADCRGALWVNCSLEGVCWPAEGPQASTDSGELSDRMKALSHEQLLHLVFGFVNRMENRVPRGPQGREKTLLPIPAEYHQAGFRELLSALSMSLPHPEWLGIPLASPQATLAPSSQEPESRDEGRGGDTGGRESSSSRPSQGQEASPVRGEEPNESPADGRFSLLEID